MLKGGQQSRLVTHPSHYAWQPLKGPGTQQRHLIVYHAFDKGDESSEQEFVTSESEASAPGEVLQPLTTPRQNLAAPHWHQTTLHLPSPPLQASSPITRPSVGSFEAVSGWVMALAVLAAIRLGRDQADEDRLDLRSLQSRQEESRVQSAELREKRRAFLEAEQARKEQEAQRRVQEARELSQVAERERVSKETEYRETAAKETARLWEQQQAARRAFEAQEALMGDELTRRTEIEVKLRIEAERKKLQDKENAKLEAETKARQEAEEERVKEEEARAAEALRIKLRQEERQKLRELQVTRTITFSGSASIEAAPYNSLTTGRVSLPARVQVTLELGLAVGSDIKGEDVAESENEYVRRYESIEAAIEASEFLSADVCSAAVAQASKALKSDASISTLMDPHEINYWARICLFKCHERCQQALKQVVPLAGSSRLEQRFDVEVPYACLPSGHPLRLDSQLATSAGLVAAGLLDQAVAMVDKVIEDEDEELGVQLLGSGSGSEMFFSSSLSTKRLSGSMPPLSVAALIYAQLVDRAAGAAGAPAPAAVQTSSSDDGSQEKGDELLFANLTPPPSGVQGAAALAKYQLEQRTKKLKEDALAPSALLLLQCLGPKHPVATVVAALAERTMSVEANMKMEARRTREELAAVAVANAQRRSAIDNEGKTIGETKTPVPERLWAIRNVANNMIRFGSSSSSTSSGQDQRLGEAVSMLGEADALALAHYGRTHPARLATLLDYHEGLGTLLLQAKAGSVDAIQSTAKIVAASEDAVSISQEIAERYRSQGDPLSSLLILEAAIADFSSLLPARHSGTSAAQEVASALLSNLTSAEMQVVLSKRRSGGVLRHVAKEFNEELGAYMQSRKSSKIEQWRTGSKLGPIRS